MYYRGFLLTSAVAFPTLAYAYYTPLSETKIDRILSKSGKSFSDVVFNKNNSINNVINSDTCAATLCNYAINACVGYPIELVSSSRRGLIISSYAIPFAAALPGCIGLGLFWPVTLPLGALYAVEKMGYKAC